MSLDEDYDVIYKIIIIGDSGVGKSNILSRYLRDEFKQDSKSTVGVEFGAKKLTINNTTIKAQIWDTAGQERYRSITSTYYKGSKGCFIVYDITQTSTFESVDRWYNEMKKTADHNISIVLVGNKCDLDAQRQVTKEAGEEKAKTLNVPFFETSALANIQIEKVFNTMIEDIHEKYSKLAKNDMDGDDFDFVKSGGVDLIKNNNADKQEIEKNTCCN